MRVTNGELDHVALGDLIMHSHENEKATRHEPTGETSLSLTACRFMGFFSRFWRPIRQSPWMEYRLESDSFCFARYNNNLSGHQRRRNDRGELLSVSSLAPAVVTGQRRSCHQTEHTVMARLFASARRIGGPSANESDPLVLRKFPRIRQPCRAFPRGRE
ncbi:hypothetical protein BC826DRAFT_529215 [Russula brevipes]|nr:hypothetical protein BC826DRAFT_529215 [Russula brevipes]